MIFIIIFYKVPWIFYKNEININNLNFKFKFLFTIFKGNYRN